MTDQILTQETLKELIHYNPGTGFFTWKPRNRKWFKTESSFKTWHKRFCGKTAGGRNASGYRQIVVLSKRYYGHRLAFLYMTGSFPPVDTDHEEGNRDDNRWDKIRAVTTTENTQNSHLRNDNTSGVVGVCWHNQIKRWMARINVNGKNVSLGCFGNIEDATKARKDAEVKYGFHQNHGRKAS